MKWFSRYLLTRAVPPWIPKSMDAQAPYIKWNELCPVCSHHFLKSPEQIWNRKATRDEKSHLRGIIFVNIRSILKIKNIS